MASHRSGRIGAWTGIAFVGLGLASFLVSSGSPDSGDDRAAQLFRDYYSKQSNLGKDGLTWTLMAFGVLAFLWFLSVLWSRLRTAEGQSGPLAQVALVGGGVFSVLLFAGVSMFSVIGITLDYSDAYRLDTADAILFQSIGYLFLVGAMLAAGALTAATFFLARKTRVIPMWVAWFGLVVSVATLGIYFTAFFAFPALLLWILLVSVSWLLAGRKGPAGAAAPAS